MTDDTEVTMPEAVEAFSDHFTDPVYRDQAGEFAPFGTDEGSDLLYEWAGRRGELNDASTVAQILEIDSLDVLDEDLTETDGRLELAPSVVGAAFTLLYLTGQIDPAGKDLALAELNVMIDSYGPQPELLRQRDDLRAWES
jgi:uncharacterized protein YfeS